jgi:curved DNA-binding protein CbpA
VRRKFTDSALQDLLQPFLDLYLAPHAEPGQRFQELPLELDERSLVERVDGRRTLRELVDKSELPPKQARQLLYTLIATEMVQATPRPAKKPVRLDDAPSLPPSSPSSSAPPPLPRRPGTGAPSAQPPPLPPRRPTTSLPPTGPGAAGGATGPLPTSSSSSSLEPVLAPAAISEAVSIEELRARLVERARLLKRQNHFEALGVSQRASTDEIQRAYFALVRDLHPDRLRRAGDGAVPADARALAESIHHQLTTAFETLSEERRRADYAARLEQGGRTSVSEDLTRLLQAETKFRKGEAALDAGKLVVAASLFRDAAALYPEEGEFQASLAWALFQQTPDDPVVQVDAIGRLQRATELAPRYDRGWLWLGRVLQRAGRPGEALKQFERALQCNPDSREAQSELRLLSPAR